MSVFKKIQSRQIQRKANNFINSLDKKNEKEIEQLYLDNKEFENNEIVLSYLFFKHPSLIRILPLDFQVSRINSNLSMFDYGSNEAKKELISKWIKDNKFFMNANVVKLSDEEYDEYLKIYFKQPEDVAKLFMEDINKVVKTLVDIDKRETEEIIKKIKDNLTSRQWDFVILAYPPFIKYANQETQNKYATDEKYNKYINGTARRNFINSEIEKIKENTSLLKDAPFDVQSEYIKVCPYMMNDLDDETLIELLKYNNDLIKYVNMPALKSQKDNCQEIIFGLLENIESKPIKEIIDIIVNKGLLNAKGKLYRFDYKSNDISYQYTKRAISIFQKLNIEQMVSLIMIDVNYALPYIVPIYADDEEKNIKEKIIIDCNSRCLNLFKAYYSKEIYDSYYKVINKIYNEILTNIEKYDYTTDYDSLFDLFKVLFNKTLITKNNVEKITVFIGISLLHKNNNKGNDEVLVNLLNDILSKGYEKEISNDSTIYNINTLELYDNRFDFISKDLLYEYSKYNFANISSLLFIIKAKKISEYFKKYYEIISNIYGENKESLFKAVENFQYYLPLLKDLEGKELTATQEENLIKLLSTFGNFCNIDKVSDLDNYEIILAKKLINELGIVKEDSICKNLLATYLFNRGYTQKGNIGLLESDTIKEILDIFDSEILREFKIDDKNVFSNEECDLLDMIKLLFNDSSIDTMFEYIENFISNKVNRNIISIIDFFNKIKKYRIELINQTIVNLEEIKNYQEQRPDLIFKEIRSGVTVYSINNQDFKVLCSLNDDKIHYLCCDISEVDSNAYGYDKLIKDGSIRFAEENEKTIIKCNKDNKKRDYIKPSYIIVFKEISDSVLNIARSNNLPIIIREE